MKVGLVFHKSPLVPPTGIDLIRLKAIASGLIRRGIETEVLAPVHEEGAMEPNIPVRPLHHLRRGHYDIVKTCYHFSIELIQAYDGPVVSRIVRVVDSRLPERDEKIREQLLRCQRLISRRASVLVVNNVENARRWRRFYGRSLPIVLVPTGCPEQIPAPQKNPFDGTKRHLLFLGSLAAPRMIGLLNTLADRLKETAQIHVVGRNKVRWYGAGEGCDIDPLVRQHGEAPEPDIWDYLYHADIGLALATGPHPFDNDLSKITSYLRAGLPVLSESPVLNNDRIRETRLGRVFRFDHREEMIAGAIYLLEHPPTLENRNAARGMMATEHSWDRRVEVYERLFKNLYRSA